MIGHRLAGMLLAIAFAASAPVAEAGNRETPVGAWMSISDKTGKAEAIVEIYRDHEELKGVIRKLFDPEAVRCEQCPGDKKDRPLLGLEIVWGIKESHGRWGGGKLLDPASGEIYDARMELSDDGAKLKLRGYVGMPLFGRTQTWVRVAR